jgi:hypothetical protein
MNDHLTASVGLLPLVIAQLPAAKQSDILTVLLGGAALAVIANQIFTLWRNATGRFQERGSTGPGFQLTSVCEKLHNKVEDKMEEVGKRITDAVEKLSKEAEGRSAAVHRRIDPVIEKVAAVGNVVENHLQDHRSGRFTNGN